MDFLTLMAFRPEPGRGKQKRIHWHERVQSELCELTSVKEGAVLFFRSSPVWFLGIKHSNRDELPKREKSP